MQNIDYIKLEKTAQPGAFSRFDMEVLVPEIKKLESKDVYLEIGVDRGRSLSIANLFAKEGVKLYGVDINETKELKRYLKKNKHITFIHGDSVEVAKEWKKANKIKVLFIDGDHSYEGCKRDIQAWFPHLTKDAVILFHDCDETSPGVVAAVGEFAKKVGKFVHIFKVLGKNTSMAKIAI